MVSDGLLIERVFGLMAVKGFSEDHLIALGYSKERIISWRYTTRRPKAPDGFKIAAWLEVRPEYLYGRASDLEGLEAWEVASRCSLEMFCRNEPKLAPEARAIFEHYAQSPGAPRRVAHWKDLYERFFEPATRFGQRRWKEAQKMGRSSARPGS
jgi:hypothetical protein